MRLAPAGNDPGCKPIRQSWWVGPIKSRNVNFRWDLRQRENRFSECQQYLRYTLSALAVAPGTWSGSGVDIRAPVNLRCASATSSCRMRSSTSLDRSEVRFLVNARPERRAPRKHLQLIHPEPLRAAGARTGLACSSRSRSPSRASHPVRH